MASYFFRVSVLLLSLSSFVFSATMKTIIGGGEEDGVSALYPSTAGAINAVLSDNAGGFWYIPSSPVSSSFFIYRNATTYYHTIIC